LSAIYRPASWLEPLDWRQLFGNDRLTEIDIGCGKGAFLLWAAQVRPLHNFVGVERQLVRVRKVDKKVQRFGLHNVRLIRVEASYFVSKLVPEGSVSAYHIFFPDPWPKRRHHPRRLFNAGFAQELSRTLMHGGTVNVTTDDADYFVHIDKVMTESGRFGTMPPERLPPEAKTEFENVFVAQRKPIHRTRFVRQD
jgi:tRNA (guanine-N7-)-methyltransferase